MSFMYGPEYLKVDFPPALTEKFPHYNLYIYHDVHTPRGKDRSQQGVPVVFVPGSKGSYQQVRSLASTSNQLFPSSPLDFFTVDFNEEPSGLYGGILSQQAAFLQECIKQIGMMYGLHQSTRVILIGHSMGGIVARAVFSQPGFLPSSVHSIFTLSTPNNGPVILLDSHMESFYSQVNQLWQAQKNLSLHNIPFISLSGGIRDLMVFTHLTPLLNFTDYFAVTSSMPHVWTSNDHLSIAWCRQLMEVMVNLLHDFLDPSTNQLTSDFNAMKEVLDYHLVRANAGPRMPRHPIPEMHPFPPATEFILEDELSWKYTTQKVLTVVCLLMPLAEAEKAVIVASGIERHDWLFACRSEGDRPHCSEGKSLSRQAGMSLGVEGGYRTAHVSMSPLLRQDFTHLAVLLSPPGSKVKVVGDRYRPQLRQRHLQVPGPWRFLVNLLQPLPLLTSPVSEGALYYNLTLLGVDAPWHSHTLLLHTRLCRSKVQGESLVKLYIPWTQQSYYYPSRSKNGYVSHVPLKLQVPRPPDSSAAKGVQVHLYLDPECGYQLSISPSVGGMFQQLVRFYWSLVPSQVVALLLVILSGQLLHLHLQGSCPSSFRALQSFPSMLTLAVLPVILYLCNMNLGLPPSSDHVLYSRGLYFIALRFLLYYASYGLMILFVSLLTAALLLLGKVAHRLPLPGPLSGRAHLALVVTTAVALEVVALAVAGSLAIFLAALAHLAYVVGIVEESRVRESRRGPDAHNTRWHLHISLAGLWVWLGVCSAPSLYVWLWSGGFVLHSDPHRAAAAVVVAAAACLWYRPPPIARQHLKLVAYLVHGVAILCSIYGPTAPHLLLYFICVALGLLAAQQMTHPPSVTFPTWCQQM